MASTFIVRTLIGENWWLEFELYQQPKMKEGYKMGEDVSVIILAYND